MAAQPATDGLDLTAFEPPLKPVRYPSYAYAAELRFRSTEELERSRLCCQNQVLDTCLQGARSRCTLDAVKHCRSHRWQDKVLSFMPFLGEGPRRSATSPDRCESTRLRCEDEYLEGCDIRSRVRCEEHAQEFCKTLHGTYGVEPSRDGFSEFGDANK